MGYALTAILALALIIVSAGYLRTKRHIKSLSYQIKTQGQNLRSVSLELSDRDTAELALQINRMAAEKDKALLDEENNSRSLKSAAADLSHDMRTPLTSAIGYLQLLDRSDLDEKQRQLLKTALEKSHGLRELLSGFFELTFLEGSDAVYTLVKTDIAKTAAETILGFADEFEKNDIEPVFEIPDRPVFISGDAELLQRAVQNIVSNCVKYSEGDAFFRITEGQTVSFICENHAQNAGQIDVQRIFERYYRADYSRGGQGSGLGLSIAKLIAGKMNGSVSASVNDGVFSVSMDFPKYISDEDQAAAGIPESTL